MAGKRSVKADREAEVQSRIRVAAYERWRSRGMPDGTALDDWLAAEAELLAARPPRKKAAAPKKRAVVPRKRAAAVPKASQP